MFKELIYENLKIELTENQLELFETYFNFLVEFNEHTNLTRITDKTDVYIKHFLDSILLSKSKDFNKDYHLCDMGAGAGFPSIPLLIVYPTLKIVIVESQIKRVNFLNQLKAKLELNYEVVHERVEVYAKSHQQQFDLVTARALGELNLILEYGMPMLKIGGYFIAPKGTKYQDELMHAQNALKKLGGLVHTIDQVMLPSDLGMRANIWIEKEKHTEGFPRPYAQIIKKPL